MPFLETPRFPDEVSAWMVGGEEFLTAIAENQGGYETCNSIWSVPRRKYAIGAGLREIRNAVATKAFFQAVRGRANGFRVRDPFDNAVDVANGVLSLISGTQYQLYKNYTTGAITTSYKIVKPVAGTVQIFRAGVLVGSATVDTTTGIATVPAAAGVLAWSGSFDIPVRFDVDWLQIGLDPGGLINWNGVALQELRL